MDYFIGIDIGTTSTKAVAFSATGEIIGRETIAYDITHPQPAYSEQDPDIILEAVINSIAQLTDKLRDATPILISFSAAMHSLLAIDKEGKLLTQCIIWADNRASGIAEHLRNTAQGKDFYEASGVPIHAMTPFAKLLWLKQFDADNFAKAHKFVGIKEYILFRFFGEYKVDSAIASATGLLNIRSLQWDESILAFAGIRADQLPEVVEPCYCFNVQNDKKLNTDDRLKNVSGSKFIIGGSDGGLANLGSGAIDANAMAITIGTSSAVRVVSEAVSTDPEMRTFCYHMNKGSYIIGGASNNGAVVLQWLKDDVLQSHETHEELFKALSTVAPGADGLIFIPYLLGERAPVWNSEASAVYFGLNITHTQSHFLRAAAEGVIYSVYSIGRILMEKRRIELIHATGGFTQSPAWVQMLCDMFNCPVQVSEAVESSALGAVIVGRQALGLPTEWLPRDTAIYSPDKERHQVYRHQFEKFERLYSLLKPEMGC